MFPHTPAAQSRALCRLPGPRPITAQTFRVLFASARRPNIPGRYFRQAVPALSRHRGSDSTPVNAKYFRTKLKIRPDHRPRGNIRSSISVGIMNHIPREVGNQEATGYFVKKNSGAGWQLIFASLRRIFTRIGTASIARPLSVRRRRACSGRLYRIFRGLFWIDV